MSRVLLNIGCGSIAPIGWINTDKSLGRWISSSSLVRPILKSSRQSSQSGVVTFQNLRRNWRFKDDFADVIYMSHVLEHLGECERLKVYSEARRVLRDNGVLRLVVPDLQGLAVQYLKNLEDGDANAAGEFLYWMNLHLENVYRRDRSMLRKLFDGVMRYPHLHRIMFDRASVAREVVTHGWKPIGYYEYGQSPSIPEIRSVEASQEICPSIYVECRKA